MAIALFEGFLGREAEVGGVKCTVDLEATMNADLDIGPRSGEARLSREEVLHREGGRLWPIAAALALGVVACVALAAAGRVDNAYGLAVALGCIWLAGLVPYFVSRRLYSTVTVTTRELRVGREAFPIAELDRELLERQLREDHPPVTPRDSFRGSGPGVTMAGGSFGASLTDRAHLAFRRTDSDAIKAAPTRDPRRLAAVLLDAMGEGSSSVRP